MGFDPCKFYGHRWQTNAVKSKYLPQNYVVKECKWCEESKVVLERGPF